MISYIPVALLAFALNGVSVLTNKFLLTKRIPHPLSFVFYISVSSLIILLALPLTKTLSLNTFMLLSASTLLWTGGAYFLFSALKVGLASRVAPTIGTLTPVFLIIYYFIFTRSISLNEVWGASLATLGLLIIVWHYLRSHLKLPAKRDRTNEIIFEILSGLLFAVSYIFLKEAYNHTDFLTGLIYSRFILIPVGIVILLIPALRKLVFASNQDKINFFSKTGVLFVSSQVAGGVSQFLLTLAVSFANPALVNSLQGIQYIILFAASLFLSRRFPDIFREEFTKTIVIQKIIGILIVSFALFMLAFARTGPAKATLGVSYSPRYAESLGLNPKATFIQILDDLSPKTVRIPVYWDQVQPSKDKFDYSLTDYYVKQSQERGIQLTLVIGLKVPRYPECYIPSWAKGLQGENLNSALYAELTGIINHYKDLSSLGVWQIENEPLFPFGKCPEVDYSRLNKEVAIVHRLDPKHPVMVTESGEFGLWLTTANMSDIVGTTLYRRTLAPYVTWFKSPLPPFFYQFKGMIVHLFYPDKKIFVSELQEEPWANIPITQTTLEYQTNAFPLADMAENVSFSKEAGFDTIYLWGTEWWYYLKKQNHPEYLNKAIMIFNDIN